MTKQKKILTNITDIHFETDTMISPTIFTPSHILKQHNTISPAKHKSERALTQPHASHTSPSKKPKITTTSLASPSPQQIHKTDLGESQSKFTRILNSSCQPKNRVKERWTLEDYWEYS